MQRQSSWDGGYSSSSYDKYVQEQSGNKKSVANRMQQQYWVTKQSVLKKLGRKEDEHVVAGDAELDAKLETFKAIQNSCMEMLRIIEKYQDNICALSQEESSMGRFLKQYSSIDKTRAGKMMAAVGKAQTSSSEQRLMLRPALARLYQEIETFRYRAISDTLMTINRMEASRLEYRAALLWMKDISKELDPDTYKQLEKFRKVQTQVRTTKAKFEKLKNDVCQKVDLLGASRCNLFSHTLASYQNMLLHFWEKTSRTMAAVQEGFRGYQHYEFNMLKELSETSKQLAQMTGAKDIIPNWDKLEDEMKETNGHSRKTEEEEDEDTYQDYDDQLIDLSDISNQPTETTGPTRLTPFLDDHQLINIETLETNGHVSNNENQEVEGGVREISEEVTECENIDLTQASKQLAEETNPKTGSQDETEVGQEVRPDSWLADEEAHRKRLIALGEDSEVENVSTVGRNASKNGDVPEENSRLLGEEEMTAVERERTAFMNLIGGQERQGAQYGGYTSADLMSANPDDLKDDMELLNEILNLGSTTPSELGTPDGMTGGLTEGSSEVPAPGGFMPSDLLELSSMMADLQAGSSAPPGAPGHAPPQYNDLFADRTRALSASQSAAMSGNKTDSSKPQAFKKGQKQDMSAWFNLFADLDPLGNPDDIGREKGREIDDRNC